MQPPLCAVRAGQKIKLVFYIGEKEETSKKKEAGRGSRLQPPLCAVRAGQKINLVFYIEERKKEIRKTKAGRASRLQAPPNRRPRRTKEKIGIQYW